MPEKEASRRTRKTERPEAPKLEPAKELLRDAKEYAQLRSRHEGYQEQFGGLDMDKLTAVQSKMRSEMRQIGETMDAIAGKYGAREGAFRETADQLGMMEADAKGLSRGEQIDIKKQMERLAERFVADKPEDRATEVLAPASEAEIDRAVDVLGADKEMELDENDIEVIARRPKLRSVRKKATPPPPPVRKTSEEVTELMAAIPSEEPPEEFRAKPKAPTEAEIMREKRAAAGMSPDVVDALGEFDETIKGFRESESLESLAEKTAKLNEEVRAREAASTSREAAPAAPSEAEVRANALSMLRMQKEMLQNDIRGKFGVDMETKKRKGLMGDLSVGWKMLTNAEFRDMMEEYTQLEADIEDAEANP